MHIAFVTKTNLIAYKFVFGLIIPASLSRSMYCTLGEILFVALYSFAGFI